VAYTDTDRRLCVCDGATERGFVEHTECLVGPAATCDDEDVDIGIAVVNYIKSRESDEEDEDIKGELQDIVDAFDDEMMGYE